MVPAEMPQQLPHTYGVHKLSIINTNKENNVILFSYFNPISEPIFLITWINTEEIMRSPCVLHEVF